MSLLLRHAHPVDSSRSAAALQPGHPRGQPHFGWDPGVQPLGPLPFGRGYARPSSKRSSSKLRAGLRSEGGRP
jgi:hypothetical protein